MHGVATPDYGVRVGRGLDGADVAWEKSFDLCAYTDMTDGKSEK